MDDHVRQDITRRPFSDTWVPLLVLLLALILFGYVAWRACSLSFVCDEAGTYSDHVVLSLKQIVLYECPKRYTLGNNHLLNTLLMKGVAGVFGVHEWSLRLPNVMAYAMYLWVSAIWLRRFVRREFVLFGLCLLNLNPYFLDFFSLARGYGLAMAFMMASVYCLCVYVQTGRPLTVWASYGWAALAVLSQFCMLNYFLALAVAFNVFYVLSLGHEESPQAGRVMTWASGLIRFNQPVIVVGILLALVIVHPMITIMRLPAVLEGGVNGFWPDTVRSLIFRFLYYVPYGVLTKAVVAVCLAVAVLVPLIAMATTLAALARRRQAILREPFVLALLLLLVAALGTVFQYHLFGVKYLINRTGLFFLPLFALCATALVSYWWGRLLERSRLRRLIGMSTVVAVLGLGSHFVRAANGQFAIDYKFDACTKEMLSEVRSRQIQASGSISPIRLGVNILFWPSVNFYQQHMKYDWISGVTLLGKEPCDYYYLLPELDRDFMSRARVEIVKEYPLSYSSLARPARRP